MCGDEVKDNTFITSVFSSSVVTIAGETSRTSLPDLIASREVTHEVLQDLTHEMAEPPTDTATEKGKSWEHSGRARWPPK